MACGKGSQFKERMIRMPTWLLLILLAYSSLCSTCPVFIDCKTPEQGLEDLNRRFPAWRENYEVEEFDCSEMSALVNQYFKCAGMKSKMEIGNSKEFGHAWVVVDSKYIEATRLYISDPTNYNQYINMGEASYVGIPEVDWWNSKYIHDQMDVTIWVSKLKSIGGIL